MLLILWPLVAQWLKIAKSWLKRQDAYMLSYIRCALTSDGHSISMTPNFRIHYRVFGQFWKTLAKAGIGACAAVL